MKYQVIFAIRIMILSLELGYSVDNYSTRCSNQLSVYREQHIFKRNYEITVVVLWRRFICPDYIYRDVPLNLLLRFG
jgi:hypothetical protein